MELSAFPLEAVSDSIGNYCDNLPIASARCPLSRLQDNSVPRAYQLQTLQFACRPIYILWLYCHEVESLGLCTSSEQQSPYRKQPRAYLHSSRAVQSYIMLNCSLGKLRQRLTCYLEHTDDKVQAIHVTGRGGL
jgi:hypothetical protein